MRFVSNKTTIIKIPSRSIRIVDRDILSGAVSCRLTVHLSYAALPFSYNSPLSPPTQIVFHGRISLKVCAAANESTNTIGHVEGTATHALAAVD